MRNIGLITLVFIVGFFSCKSVSETTGGKIDNSELTKKQGIVYALPKTSISFKVEAVRTELVPGPYHEFAEQYVGISNVPSERTTSWEITDIEINSFNEIDESEFYILNPSGKFNVNITDLVKNELVFPVNVQVKDQYTNQFFGKNQDSQGVVFKDLSVTKYIGEEKVTYFKRVQRDSIFAKVPVTKTKSVYKSFESKAEEAASFIFMIREKRFELLSGMADYYPDGKALEVALKELERLENEYLDLFIGKSYQSTYVANFEFSPSNEELNQPNILFRFTEEKGILPANDLSGRPIIVELEKINELKNLSKLDELSISDKDKLFYRIPQLTKVSIIDGSSYIAGRKLKMYQYGETIEIPSMYLLNNESFIEFYYEEE